MSIALNFRKTGEGPALIILHGLYGASDNWLSIGKKLGEQYTVYLLDLRNHGASPHTLSHSYLDMSEDLAGFMEQHEIGRATLLGHSMGGKAAMLFASEYPEKIDRLVVADIAPKDYLALPPSNTQASLHERILELLDSLDLASMQSRKEIDQWLSGSLNSVGLRQFIMKNLRRSREGKFQWKINVPLLRQSLPEIIRDVNETSFDDRKPILSYPVLFIRGLNSNYIMDEDIPVIRDIYPEARVVDIPDAGHWLHAEQPERFIEAVLSVV